jgi:hypothetical protein
MSNPNVKIETNLRLHPFADVLEPMMQRIVLTLLAASQESTPVDTGTLRRSLTTHVEPGGLRGQVGTNITYAPFVHKRVPFFSEAIESTADQVERTLLEAGDDYFASIT